MNGFDRRKTAGANRQARDIEQGLAANPAL